MPDENDEPVDEIPKRERSFVRRAKSKMDEVKLLEKLIPPIIAAILGATGGVASSKVKDADHDAVVQANRAEILALQQQLEMLRAGFHQRVEVEESEREEDIEKLRDRVLYLEAKTGVRNEPPAAAAAPPAESH